MRVALKMKPSGGWFSSLLMCGTLMETPLIMYLILDQSCDRQFMIGRHQGLSGAERSIGSAGSDGKTSSPTAPFLGIHALKMAIRKLPHCLGLTERAVTTRPYRSCRGRRGTHLVDGRRL